SSGDESSFIGVSSKSLLLSSRDFSLDWAPDSSAESSGRLSSGSDSSKGEAAGASPLEGGLGRILAWGAGRSSSLRSSSSRLISSVSISSGGGGGALCFSRRMSLSEAERGGWAPM